MLADENLKLTRNTSGTLKWTTFRKYLNQWQRDMEFKSKLGAYRQFEGTWGLTMDVYDNSRGSRLLADTDNTPATLPSTRIAPNVEHQKRTNMSFWNARKANSPGGVLDQTGTSPELVPEGSQEDEGHLTKMGEARMICKYKTIYP